MRRRSFWEAGILVSGVSAIIAGIVIRATNSAVVDHRYGNWLIIVGATLVILALVVLFVLSRTEQQKMPPATMTVADRGSVAMSGDVRSDNQSGGNTAGIIIEQYFHFGAAGKSDGPAQIPTPPPPDKIELRILEWEYGGPQIELYTLNSSEVPHRLVVRVAYQGEFINHADEEIVVRNTYVVWSGQTNEAAARRTLLKVPIRLPNNGVFTKRLARKSASGRSYVHYEHHLDEPALETLPQFQRLAIVLECIGHGRIERELATFDAPEWRWPPFGQTTTIKFTPPLPLDD